MLEEIAESGFWLLASLIWWPVVRYRWVSASRPSSWESPVWRNCRVITCSPLQTLFAVHNGTNKTRVIESVGLFSQWHVLDRTSSSSLSSVTSWASIDLFRPSQIVCSKVFQVVFVHLVYSSALFLASCCCSFLLHVVDNLICIFFNFSSAGSTLVLPKFLPFIL